jgi:hypothetical protein
LSLRGGPYAPRQGRLYASPQRLSFPRFSASMPLFVRFPEASNRVESTPLARRLVWRVRGENKVSLRQGSECGLGVERHKKLRGKAPENLCAADLSVWTLCPLSTLPTLRWRREKRTVNNLSVLHRLSTASADLSPTSCASQGVKKKGLRNGTAQLVHEKAAPLLL